MPTLLKRMLWALKIPYLPEAVRAIFKGPYTVKFPFGETVDTGAYRGVTVWDEKACIGCGACYEVCPSGAIQMVDDTQSSPPTRRFVLDYGRCIFCGHCHYNCITDDGIYQTTRWDVITLDRRQATTKLDKELLMCEKCGGVVSARDHVVWVARKVGPKVFANPTLALTLEGQLVPAPQEPGRRQTEAGGGAGTERSDIMRILCPHCRRLVVFSEIT